VKIERDTTVQLDFSKNHFELFGLPVEFDIDAASLSARYQSLQSALHPDRYASGTERERRLSMQAASQVNEAYRVLRSPLARASYILSLHGIDLDTERDTRMSPMFLMQQMEWREQLDDARSIGKPELLGDLQDELDAAQRDIAREAAELIEAEDWPQARDALRRWQFLDKLAREADDAAAALEDAL
jgi:molecular chaperone HscB